MAPSAPGPGPLPISESTEGSAASVTTRVLSVVRTHTSASGFGIAFSPSRASGPSWSGAWQTGQNIGSFTVTEGNQAAHIASGVQSAHLSESESGWPAGGLAAASMQAQAGHQSHTQCRHWQCRLPFPGADSGMPTTKRPGDSPRCLSGAAGPESRPFALALTGGHLPCRGPRVGPAAGGRPAPLVGARGPGGGPGSGASSPESATTRTLRVEVAQPQGQHGPFAASRPRRNACPFRSTDGPRKLSADETVIMIKYPCCGAVRPYDPYNPRS
jgi:hypothetical protein